MKKRIVPSLVFFLVLSSFKLLSQNEAAKWYFGQNATLDFSSGSPIFSVNTTLNATNGSASIADGTGNLLFYTDGSTVWNKNHTIMANGTGLLGGSPHIVKQPGNPNIYFIFTSHSYGGFSYSCTLNYSTVDMSLASGMGSVTAKSTLVWNNSSRDIASVKHCNGTDIWLVSHDGNSYAFRSTLITAVGVNTQGVNSLGNFYFDGQPGQLKVSPNGKKLGIALGHAYVFQIYDFDNSTGMVSMAHFLTFALSNQTANGCEFSPDGTKFYGSVNLNGPARIIQYNLCGVSNSSIQNSKYVVSMPTTSTGIGYMQLAVDGKIYVGQTLTAANYLAVIASPNSLGSACNLTLSALSLLPKTSGGRLPGFLSNTFRTKPPVYTFTSACSSVSFSALSSIVNQNCHSSTDSIIGMKWDFDEPSSGLANNSFQPSPTHTYLISGSYTPKLILYYNCGSDTITQTLNIGAGPVISISGNTTICPGETATLTVSGANSYTWSNTQIGPTILVAPIANFPYSVTASSPTNICTSSKVVLVNVSECLGLKNENGENEYFRAYPNPVQNKLRLEAKENLKILIYDQQGSIVTERFFEKGEHIVDMSQYSSGIYLIRGSSKDFEGKLRIIKIE